MCLLTGERRTLKPPGLDPRLFLGDPAFLGSWPALSDQGDARLLHSRRAWVRLFLLVPRFVCACALRGEGHGVGYG